MGEAYLKGGKHMISKHKLYRIALASLVMVLILVSTACAVRVGDVILTTDPCTQSVDFLKFPACGCDGGCGSFLDHFRHCSHDTKNCTEYKNDNRKAE